MAVAHWSRYGWIVSRMNDARLAARSSQAKTQVVTMPSKPIALQAGEELVEVDLALADVEVLVHA